MVAAASTATALSSMRMAARKAGEAAHLAVGSEAAVAGVLVVARNPVPGSGSVVGVVEAIAYGIRVSTASLYAHHEQAAAVVVAEQQDCDRTTTVRRASVAMAAEAAVEDWCYLMRIARNRERVWAYPGPAQTVVGMTASEAAVLAILESLGRSSCFARLGGVRRVPDGRNGLAHLGSASRVSRDSDLTHHDRAPCHCRHSS